MVDLPGAKVDQITFDTAPTRIWQIANGDPTSIRLVEFDSGARPSAHVKEGDTGTIVQATAAPENPSGGTARLFFIAIKTVTGVRAGWSRAYLQIPSWQAPTHSVRRIAFPDLQGHKLDVFRLAPDSGAFLPLAETETGVYKYSSIAEPDSRAEIARKLSTAIMAGCIVLLALPLIKIKQLANSIFKHAQGAAVTSVFCIAAIWSAFMLLFSWPTVLGWDAFSPVVQHGSPGMSLWYGLGYPLITSASINLGGLEVALVLRMVVFFIVLIWVALTAMKSGSSPSIIAAWILLCAGLTSTSIVVVTELRDSVNAILLTAYSVLAYTTMRGAPKPSFASTLGLVLGGFALALLRVDNIPFVFVLLVGLVTLQRSSRSLLCALATAMACLAANPALEYYLFRGDSYVQGEKRLYEEAALINPLVGYLNANSVSDTDKDELTQVLDNVIDVPYAKEHWNPFGIVYWHEKNKGAPSPQSLSQLKSVYLRMLLRYPATYLKMRGATMLMLLNEERAALRLTGGFKSAMPTENYNFRDHLFSTRPDHVLLRELSGLSRLDHLSQSATKRIIDLYASIATHLPPLILAGILAMMTRRIPATGILALAAVTRAGVFFLLAPATMFAYLSELQLFMILLPLLAIAEWRSRNAPNSISRSTQVYPSRRSEMR
ncbi:hypothetical protein P9239_13320 [Caballeronia sp. LZ062]|uniref:hypothetical protein n=1 Tax=unclassified Caballeronia TaxID=2646786 RepID=UPI0028559C50|nr:MULTISPECIES: hypothetical protein [unclassified Caballeronia]MDR5854146.1 hypothetical protein [Caballeronia sp. LZ050]MDR5871323.1 hypothetical protein [Caballeronia sp. LZ062]